jgi:hypothetical protein
MLNVELWKSIESNTKMTYEILRVANLNNMEAEVMYQNDIENKRRCS